MADARLQMVRFYILREARAEVLRGERLAETAYFLMPREAATG
jgi:hypothetical protein